MPSPIFCLTGRYGPLQGSSSAQVPQGAEVSSSHWDSPALERHWHMPLKVVSQDPARCSLSVDRCFQAAHLKGRLRKTPLCSMQGLLLPSFLHSGFLPKNLSLPKRMSTSLCYWNGDLFPLVGCNVQTSTPPGSFSRAFHNAWVAVSRTSGRGIQKLDPTGTCGWALQPRDQLRLTSYI